MNTFFTPGSSGASEAEKRNPKWSTVRFLHGSGKQAMLILANPLVSCFWQDGCRNLLWDHPHREYNPWTQDHLSFWYRFFQRLMTSGLKNSSWWKVNAQKLQPPKHPLLLVRLNDFFQCRNSAQPFSYMGWTFPYKAGHIHHPFPPVSGAEQEDSV